MIKEYVSMLTKKDIYPITNWQSIIVNHNEQYIPDKRNAPIKLHINDSCGNIKAIYAYFTKQEECLYIGITINLSKRLHGHYLAAWINSTIRNAHQLPFFKLYKEELIVRWLECDDEFDRVAIEAMLTRIYQPKYIKFMKDRVKSKMK